VALEPEPYEPPVAPPALDPEADGVLVELEVDGVLLEPETDGVLLVPDVPLGLVLIEPDELPPVPDVDGDAAGDWLSEIPATCIACWLQRSKSARLSVPPAMAAAGSSSPPTATDAIAILTLLIMEPPRMNYGHTRSFQVVCQRAGGVMRQISPSTRGARLCISQSCSRHGDRAAERASLGATFLACGRS
jgi:hypothetical protein